MARTAQDTTKKKLTDKVDKRRRARVKVGTKPDGTPDYQYVSGKSKAELEAKKKAIREEVGQAACSYAVNANKNQTFGHYTESWFSLRIEVKPNKNTRDMYYNAVFNHMMPIFQSRIMGSISPSELQSWLNSKLAYSNSFISQLSGIIKQIFLCAQVEGVIDRNPTLILVLPKGVESDGRRELTQQEETAALHVASNDREGIYPLLLFYTGVRKGEGLGCWIDDISWNDRVIHIQRDVDFKAKTPLGELKTEAADRFIPLPDALYDVLRERRKNTGLSRNHVPIIEAPRGGHLSEYTFKRMWQRFTMQMYDYDPTLESIPVKEYNRNTKRYEETERLRSILTPHYFRHNYASLLHAAGINVLQARDWLGHADIQTTLDIYTHLDKRKTARDCVELLSFFRENGNMTGNVPGNVSGNR